MWTGKTKRALRGRYVDVEGRAGWNGVVRVEANSHRYFASAPRMPPVLFLLGMHLTTLPFTSC